MSFRIRRGVREDAAALAELAARTFHDTFAADNRPEDMAAFLAASFGVTQQEGELADPDVVTLLVESPDGFAGYAQLRRGPMPACVTGESPIELWRFYIAKAWHGQGLAPLLMAHVDAEARKLGARTLWLGVWERNERAKAYYRKSGFVDVGSHTFQLGSDAQTDRILVRSAAQLAVPSHPPPSR